MGELTIDLGDVTLRAITYGSSDAPLALCLHGFPDTAHTFRHLGPHLADRGYHVVAPFLRGYAPSSLSKTDNYQLVTLAKDALTLHDRLGGDERALIVGHDWGASVAYVATGAEPNRWRHAVTMAVPPLMLFAEALSTFDQLRMSWYMFYFQNPFAESVVERQGLEFIERLWRTWSPNYAPEEDMAHVRHALGNREHLRAALGYYRAMFDATPLLYPSLQYLADSALTSSTVPTLYLHGATDGCIAPLDSTKVLGALGTDSRYDVLRDVGHFLHLEQPGTVHRALDAFLES
ncbi:MAG TPA: alpha/beta hydrolase [Acidimicrobiales bacterium]|nr:alpha/beta hydrolase [Acidimicrobiales bacterium]